MWCESLPPAQTHGLGQQAATMLHSYERISSVLQSIKTIRTMHEAVAFSKPPLVVRALVHS